MATFSTSPSHPRPKTGPAATFSAVLAGEPVAPAADWAVDNGFGGSKAPHDAWSWSKQPDHSPVRRRCGRASPMASSEDPRFNGSSRVCTYGPTSPLTSRPAPGRHY